jgi:threonine/homoserine/homoserine lactone efflux protein
MNLLFEVVYKGLALGIALCVAIGPSFFALIQTSLKYGLSFGVTLAFGIFLSDVTCVALAYLGASQLFVNPSNKQLIGVLGGTILLVFGVYNLFQKKTIAQDSDNNSMVVKKANKWLIFLKGYFLNILNPFVILLWLGWVGLISAGSEYNHLHVIVFFAVALLTVLATDILKAMAADKIKKFLNEKILRLLNRLVGIIMFICGIVMIMRVFSIGFKG